VSLGVGRPWDEDFAVLVEDETVVRILGGQSDEVGDGARSARVVRDAEPHLVARPFVRPLLRRARI